MNSALHFAFPAANPTFVGGIRRVTPSPGLLCSRLRVCSLLPPYSSSSLKVNISFPQKISIVPKYLFGHVGSTLKLRRCLFDYVGRVMFKKRRAQTKKQS
ncbi:hypothetical protein HID58_004588 [Brassica napus]|uniref:Uncharacterized protein n=1 Tax=Brassica napus TaxID=3708 RepID=A0ABQ8E6A1_BRANA|nr:hypothetical protein HID58_004588 [Brassica napus]